MQSYLPRTTRALPTPSHISHISRISRSSHISRISHISHISHIVHYKNRSRGFLMATYACTSLKHSHRRVRPRQFALLVALGFWDFEISEM